MSDCFCTKNYQCLSCEKKQTKEKRVRQISTRIAPRKVAQCGTRAGYNRHRRLNEATCDDCKKAQTQAVLKWQRQNPIRTKEIHRKTLGKAS